MLLMIYSSKFSYILSTFIKLLFSESKQIYELNPWLTYGEPMHRMRELGFHLPQLDRLDEIAFTANDIHDLAVFL